MKIVNHNNNKRITNSIIFIIIIILIYTLIAYFVKIWPFNVTSKVDLSPTTSEQKKAAEQIKSNSINKTEGDSKTTNSDQPLPATKNPDSNTYTVPVNVTSSNQDDSTLRIRILIQSLLASGKCTLTMTKDDKSYTSIVDIQALPSTSTCKGFDVPINELSAGSWNAKVDILSGDISGQTIKNIEVK